MGAIFLEYLLIQGIHLTVRLVRFRPSSARLSPPRPEVRCILQQFPAVCLPPESFSHQTTLFRQHLLPDPRHGDPAHRYSRGIPSWRRGHLSALRHGDPAHRYLRGILAWRSILLAGLRHVDPCPRVRQYQPRVSESGASTGAWRNASRRGTGCSTRGG